MKTQIISFFECNHLVATAEAKFISLPGCSEVLWSGNWKDNPPSIFKDGLPDYGYAGMFVDAMKGMADELGLDVKIAESGEWQVYEE